MATFAAIIAFLGEFFKDIPIIASWFTKTPEQKREEIDAANQAERDNVSKGGRP